MGDGRGGPGAAGECRRSGDGAKDNGVEPGVAAGISPHLPPMEGAGWAACLASTLAALVTMHFILG